MARSGKFTAKQIAKKTRTTVGNVYQHLNQIRRHHGFDYAFSENGGRVRLIVPKGATLFTN
jgi:hypothetical protein